MSIEYPACYIIRDQETDEVEWFININRKDEDKELPGELYEYLNENYDIEKVTFAEAETYELFGVAPMGSAADFCNWLVEKMDKRLKFKPLAVELDRLSDAAEYPSYYLIGHYDKSALALIRLVNSMDDILPGLEWRKKFSGKFKKMKMSYGDFEKSISTRLAPELNMKELVKLMEEF